jgi:predicted transcriptional regulator
MIMAKAKKAAKKPQKGVAGKNTGASTRKAIRAKEKQGITQVDIAKAAMRDPSVISDISKGKIKNPPSNLAAKIRKAKKKKGK